MGIEEPAVLVLVLVMLVLVLVMHWAIVAVAAGGMQQSDRSNNKD